MKILDKLELASNEVYLKSKDNILSLPEKSGIIALVDDIPDSYTKSEIDSKTSSFLVKESTGVQTVSSDLEFKGYVLVDNLILDELEIESLTASSKVTLSGGLNVTGGLVADSVKIGDEDVALAKDIPNSYTKTESDGKYAEKSDLCELDYLPAVSSGCVGGKYVVSDPVCFSNCVYVNCSITIPRNPDYGGSTSYTINFGDVELYECSGGLFTNYKGKLESIVRSNELQNKANKATTLAGYGITDAYTKTESDGRYLHLEKDSCCGQTNYNVCGLDSYGEIHFTSQDSGGSIKLVPNYPLVSISDNSGNSTNYRQSGITYKNKTINFPEKEGIFALTSDIPDTSKFLDLTANSTVHQLGLCSDIQFRDNSGSSLSIGPGLIHFYSRENEFLGCTGSIWADNYNGNLEIDASVSVIINNPSTSSLFTPTAENHLTTKKYVDDNFFKTSGRQNYEIDSDIKFKAGFVLDNWNKGIILNYECGCSLLEVGVPVVYTGDKIVISEGGEGYSDSGSESGESEDKNPIFVTDEAVVEYVNEKIYGVIRQGDNNLESDLWLGTNGGKYDVIVGCGTCQINLSERGIELIGRNSEVFASISWTSFCSNAIFTTELYGVNNGDIYLYSPMHYSKAPTENDHLSNKKYVDDQISSKLGTVFTYKGNKEYASLPTTGNKVGDVYNLTTASGDYKVGDNVVWDGTAWDKLAATVDTSSFWNKNDTETQIIKAHETTFNGCINVDKEARFNGCVFVDGPGLVGSYMKADVLNVCTRTDIYGQVGIYGEDGLYVNNRSTFDGSLRANKGITTTDLYVNKDSTFNGGSFSWGKSRSHSISFEGCSVSGTPIDIASFRTKTEFLDQVSFGDTSEFKGDFKWGVRCIDSVSFIGGGCCSDGTICDDRINFKSLTDFDGIVNFNNTVSINELAVQELSMESLNVGEELTIKDVPVLGSIEALQKKTGVFTQVLPAKSPTNGITEYQVVFNTDSTKTVVAPPNVVVTDITGAREKYVLVTTEWDENTIYLTFELNEAINSNTYKVYITNIQLA